MEVFICNLCTAFLLPLQWQQHVKNKIELSYSASFVMTAIFLDMIQHSRTRKIFTWKYVQKRIVSLLATGLLFTNQFYHKNGWNFTWCCLIPKGHFKSNYKFVKAVIFEMGVIKLYVKRIFSKILIIMLTWLIFFQLESCIQWLWME